ncbi:hypothetical protein CAI21_02880 [Alkalilimnicola ehrlichii]|uniref:Methyltransferase type 12 n=1 Tax=Alkalilimnicola ehrlichii TaxID=351052 RepID=A0A3E0X0U4_9GAMM|nr:class I SAM-dependent methyltransferase [Alkalilimnicola ehrlichii]RFA30938.1 hypothetical protein CAI21_02880 [Alkalilimnicola ehrlichii]RFA38888.1 hypothetical protein CAL65_03015 [Alkalilimnicola ehrlichii]
MSQNDYHLLQTLTQQGFHPPQAWLGYARTHGIRPVPAKKLTQCPHCGSRHQHKIGQYVYFSHLVKLNQCGNCFLLYSDTRFPNEIIDQHFELNYKDEAYFLHQRRQIFRQIADLVSSAAPLKGRILDVGGAKGHLMAVVQRQRPDLQITVNDLSNDACASAAAHFGFETICGGLSSLDDVVQTFDVVVMSDVIYYEADVQALWRLLPSLVAPGGTLIIRIPNKLLPIKLWQRLSRRLAPHKIDTRDRIPLFNPEHLFIFPPHFLAQQLHLIGFQAIQRLPSRPLTKPGGKEVVQPLLHTAARLVHSVSKGRLVISPSLLLIANRSQADDAAQTPHLKAAGA